MAALGVRSVLAFSPIPLRWASVLGLMTAPLSLILTLFAIASLLAGNVVPTWASVMSVVLLVGGIQLVAIGVIDEYMITLQNQVRSRPNYVIRSRSNLGSNSLD